MKRIYMNKKIGFLSLGLFLACMVSLSFFVQSCSQEDDMANISEALDPNIAQAPELEDYIIAGVDYGQSMTNFTNELKKIDFSKLEVTYDADGNEVIHLPATLASIGIEKKILMYNEKKETLFNKFQQFASFGNDMKNKYFQQCIQQSVNVSNKLLDMGIKASPRLKSDNEGDIYFSNLSYNAEDNVVFNYYMNTWVNSPNYTELFLVFYNSGSVSAYQSSASTPENTGNITLNTQNGNYYFPAGGSSSSVDGIGHTHTNSPNPTQPYYDSKGNYNAGDYNIPSGLNRYIYYNGALYKY